MPEHHPDDILLAGYATGSCGEAAGVVLASHVSLCSECAAVTRDLEQVGGALLEELPRSPLCDGALERALERLEEPRLEATRPLAPEPDAVFPAPLRSYLDRPFHAIAWTPVTDALSVYRIGHERDPVQLRLMRIRAGCAMPNHGHGGRELTLVLGGGFTDDGGHYLRGDLASMDGGKTHAPVADQGTDCICLALNEGGVQLGGLIGRLITPFLRF